MSKKLAPQRKSFYVVTVAAVLSALVLSACGTPSSAPDKDTVPDGYPTGHVHGMSVDPAADQILLATHDGLYNVSSRPAERIGPVIDLMGFTANEEGTLYASGHPGPGTDMPNPVGLIRSTDKGRSWQPMSRQGETDFHALAAAGNKFVGFDGDVLSSVDGRQWKPSATQFQAFDLSGTHSSGVVLATSAEGLYRSTDAGGSWSGVDGSPRLLLTAMDGNLAAGVTPAGEIYTSEDAGLTWEAKSSIQESPTALAAHSVGGVLEIWVAADVDVRVSRDGGDTLTRLEP
ncbi:F510_1955 family glycosylhydrolase [Arthrobacter roseus]|uniref:F510_1955 family glycosylhydrolase n=1 Tax=Arthrobacter roseus TaxID=136274 RepID=UPI001EF8BF2D|nr:exo-alpha-sialidase [Arthrobacter roseus]MBM7847560.1 photosystem II stability/assembly factor-like uncharacterized protein [Arthrobacter roseus]